MKVKIKLAKRHPAGVMRLGKHQITPKVQEIELDEKEQKILKSPEAIAWFEVGGKVESKQSEDISDLLGDEKKDKKKK